MGTPYITYLKEIDSTPLDRHQQEKSLYPL